jgi:hypothetical protein
MTAIDHYRSPCGKTPQDKPQSTRKARKKHFLNRHLFRMPRVFSLHFPPAFYCGRAPGHVYCVAPGRIPRRIVEWAWAIGLSRALQPRSSAPPRYEIQREMRVKSPRGFSAQPARLHLIPGVLNRQLHCRNQPDGMPILPAWGSRSSCIEPGL